MNTKGVVIVALSLGLAAVIGVTTYQSVVSKNGPASVGGQEGTSVSVTAADNDDIDEQDQDADPVQSDDSTENANVSDDTVAPDNTASTYYKEVVSTAFNIKRVVDHTNGDECSPREVFGSMYSYFYLKFDTDFDFELYLDASTDTPRYGTYEIYDDTISVVYDDGIGSEYRVLLNDDGGIDFIIVNFGDYDVYFG